LKVFPTQVPRNGTPMAVACSELNLVAATNLRRIF
jgi:hypothetical protein